MHFTRKNAIFRLSKQALRNKTQGRMLGNLVADGWAGAVMHKLAIQKCGRPMDQQTYQPYYANLGAGALAGVTSHEAA